MCEINRLLDCAHFYQRYLFIKEWFLKNTYCHRSGFPLFHSCKNPAQTYSFLIVIQVLVYTDFHEFTQVYTNLHEFQILFTRFRVLVTCFHFLVHRASKNLWIFWLCVAFFGFPVEFLNKCTEFRLNLNLKWLEISFKQSET